VKNLLSSRNALMLLLGNAAHELWHFSRLPKSRHTPPGTLQYRCNICGRPNAVDLAALERETRTCLGCGSTLRHRSVVAALSRQLFAGRSLPLDDWEGVADLKVTGVSDAELIARALGQKVSYTNTFLHQSPFLDICAPTPEHLASCDVLVCSDVLEHVPPPVERAFEGMRKVIRPGGFLLLTVPCTALEKTAEHYPNLHEYRIVERGGKPVLVNRTADGRVEEFRDLVFHGGPGETLEMRSFALVDLERHLSRAGFSTVEICAQPDFRHGVYWQRPYDVPIVAHVPGGAPPA
jgi:SAM-dependent methyltransferase